MRIKENFPLAKMTTFGVGGNARYFCEAENEKELVEALKFSSAKNIPFFVLGSGSNILVSDSGFEGLVIKMSIKGVSWRDSGDEMEMSVSAGESWDDIVGLSVEKNLYGMENLSGIPGTVGACPVQNIGAYGSEASDTIKWVRVMNTENLEIRKISAKDCCFGYRESIFKKPEGKNLIILEVCFGLKEKGGVKIEYKDLKEYFAKNNLAESNITPKEVRRAVLFVREGKLPDYNKQGNAGSFFKNVFVSQEKYEELAKIYPDMPAFKETSGNFKIPTAWIIDKVCGLKGYKIGKASVYENQPLVLVNTGGASAQDIFSLSRFVEENVFKETGIRIVPEVNFVGRF